MAGASAGIHVTNYVGLGIFVVLWIVLFRCTHILLTLLRREPLVGWAVGPFGISVMFLHEPSVFYIWLDVLFPALISGSVLYIGLFTDLTPITLSHTPLVKAIVLLCGVLITSTADVVNALLDLRHPLWGEARILRSIQLLHATWSKIHFTPFGYSYLNDRFGATPADLMQAL